MNNIYNIQSYDMLGVAVPFSTEWTSISIMLSGGADSALLAYLLCKHIEKNNINCTIEIISAIRCWKTRPWQRYNSIEVYEYLEKTFPNIDIIRNETYIAPALEHGSEGKLFKDEWGNLASGDSVQLTSYAEYICNEKNVQAVYNAVTKNPPQDVVPGGLIKRYDPAENIQTQREGITVIQPFKHINKKQVIDIYKKNNIMDLFEITRSCEGEFDDIDYKNYKPYQEVPTCGKCFWCREREWSLNEK